ncbi:MAG: hypothetical protein COX02_02465 [Candidatus Vogelbacteria bacterium CG22_combo_CG10-13_8_21_14_all_37_9]|uniref:PKD domain-containing protein n=1 Tax=Candidatus Vogelbacteria bacterium CG22_combo_CG10-13_8_21_14_all_37_9 TaxID=1975046 RepID=A0A2H0BM40_9BACT|nr:MAG: hypothetical protein BK005_00410 [bacterium CG10_37_50]PIP58048.1 MAG: hypothetical protein COX02_02465 [Candidatus Vogelbacteria bacterium CG22_combo_CG10-13_8_21_14_all_37_9]
MNKLLFSLVIIFLIWPVFVSAEISKLVFTTDPQVIKPSTLSDGLTVQTQTADGVEEKTPETIDLTFSSNSSTGEFLNEAGNPVSKTMRKNSANRTFYYRDSSLGSYELLITATGQETKKSFSANQSIVISNDISTTSDPNTETEASSTNTTSSNTTSSNSSGSVSYSAHSAQSDLGNVVIHPPEVGAGRVRLGVAGADLNFEAWRKNNAGGNFSWSFGDGVKMEGEKVIHRYEFPGEYQVVLNAYFSEGQTVARTKVLIIQPDLAISKIDWLAGFVELTNASTYEINLGGWILQDQRSSFIFPLDTIIAPKSKIKFSLSLLKLAGVGELILSAPNGRVATKVSLNQINSDLVTASTTNLSQQTLDPLTLARRRRLVAEMGALLENNNSSPEPATASLNLEAQTPQANNSTNRIVLTPQLSWWQKAVRMFR